MESVVLNRNGITINLNDFFKRNIKQTIRKAYTDKYKSKEKGSLNLYINVFVPEPKHYNERIVYYDAIKPNDEISPLMIARSVVEALLKTAFYNEEQIINLAVNKGYGDSAVKVVIERLL